MRARPKVFLDSDVIISAIISKKGSAYQIISTPTISRYISNISVKEIETVTKRLKISQSEMKKITKACQITILKENIGKIKKKFKEFTTDINDTHIIAGAKNTKARYLVTYNTRHYKREQLKRKLGILVQTPARFLQYQRSIN